MRLPELITRLNSFECAYNGHDLQENLGYRPQSFLDLSEHGYTCKSIYEYSHPTLCFLVGKYLVFRDKKPIAILTSPFLEEKSGVKWISGSDYEITKAHINNLHCAEPENPEWVDPDEEWPDTYKVPSIKNLITGVHTKAIYRGKEYTIDWQNGNFLYDYFDLFQIK